MADQNVLVRAEILFLQCLVVEATDQSIGASRGRKGSFAVSPGDHGQSPRGGINGGGGSVLETSPQLRQQLVTSLAQVCEAIIDVWVRRSQAWGVNNIPSFVGASAGTSPNSPRTRADGDGGNTKSRRRHNRHRSFVPGSGVDARCFVAYFWTTTALVDHFALQEPGMPVLQRRARQMLLHVFRSNRLRALLDERESLDASVWQYKDVCTETTVRGVFSLLGSTTTDASGAPTRQVSPEKSMGHHSRSSQSSFESDSSDDSEGVWAIDNDAKLKSVRTRDAAGLFVTCVENAMRKFADCHCRTPDIELLLLAGQLVNNRLAGAPRVLMRRILLATILMPLLGSLSCTCDVPAQMRERAEVLTAAEVAAEAAAAAGGVDNNNGGGGGAGNFPRSPSADSFTDYSTTAGEALSPMDYRNYLRSVSNGSASIGLGLGGGGGGGGGGIGGVGGIGGHNDGRDSRSRANSNRFADLGIDLVGGAGDQEQSSWGSQRSRAAKQQQQAQPPPPTIVREHALLSILSEYFCEESASVAFDLNRIIRGCREGFFPSPGDGDDDGDGAAGTANNNPTANPDAEGDGRGDSMLPPPLHFDHNHNHRRRHRREIASARRTDSADYRPWQKKFAQCVGQHYPKAVTPCIRVLLMYIKAVCKLNDAAEVNPMVVDVRGATAVQMICAMLDA